jgi:hypothetical protein
MTHIDPEMHMPTAEFRDFLESEVVREYRRNRTFRRLRAAAVIIVSAGIGMSATLASAQVRGNAQKDSVLEAANSEAMLAAMRYGLAKTQYAEEQKRVAAGADATSTLAQSELQVAEAEQQVARTILNVREIQASGLPPRDDLNAPLVKGEDFVKQRLTAQAMLADKRLRTAERNADESKRRVAVGAAEESQATAADLDVIRARGQLAVLAERLKARAEFLEKGTPMQDLARRIERVEVQQSIVAVQQSLKAAQAALTLLERRQAVGATQEVEVLRARLAVAEQQVELGRLSKRLQQLR